MKYHFNKDFIPSHTLAEQLEALKEKLQQAYTDADTVAPMDDDDLDEIEKETP